jgi:hypothetical protein
MDMLNMQIRDMEDTLKVADAYINAKLVLHDDELEKIMTATRNVNNFKFLRSSKSQMTNE